MKKRFEAAVAEYVKAFCRKHDLLFDGWVADQVGTVGVFGDYFFDLETIRIDLDTKQPKKQLFDWYDNLMNLNSDNYYNYCRKKKK